MSYHSDAGQRRIATGNPKGKGKSNDHLSSFQSIINQQDPDSIHRTEFRQKAQQLRLGISIGNGSGKSRANQQQLENAMRRRKGEVEWINEAYKVHQHISSLLQFLSSIRKPYLNLSARPTTTDQEDRQHVDPTSSTSTSSLDLTKKYLKLRHLDDRQRDEIDFQARMVIKKSIDRVQELDKAEAVRLRTSSSSPTSTLSYLLSSLSSTPQSHHLYSTQLSSHRQAITRYLSSMLAEASTKQRDLQEKRLEMKKEKNRSLANERNQSQNRNKVREGGAGGGLTDQILKGSVDGLSQNQKKKTSFNPSIQEEDDPSISSTTIPSLLSPELSSEQVQQFESESSALLKTLEQDLDQVRKAESKLMEISQMQTQLLQNLSQQNELTDRLYDEALQQTTEVHTGNEQLQMAKKRNREANKMLSVFLIGSGLGLLFLHWMD